MCFPPGARPPAPPSDAAPISGGAAGADVILTSEDGTRFRAFVARDGEGDRGVVIAPDIRGLHPFYEELAERFAAAGIPAIAFDYFGRTAGTARRDDPDFPWRDHVAKTVPAQVQGDLFAATAHLRGASETRHVFVMGFCYGGRVAFNASADQTELDGVVGFYGVSRQRDENDLGAPITKVTRMKAPVLGLFGGADPGIPAADNEAFDKALAGAHIKHHLETYSGAPHSFFDRSFADHAAACDDAWRRILAFIRTGDPAAR